MTTVKGNHPLAEIIGKKLFSIETVPRKEQGRMVNRAAMAAVKWHTAKLEAAQAENAELRAAYDSVIAAAFHANTLAMKAGDILEANVSIFKYESLVLEINRLDDELKEAKTVAT